MKLCDDAIHCGCSDIIENSVAISKEDYELFQKLAKVWFHANPEQTDSFFICGEAGENDEHGLPEFILVCPQMGENTTAVYKREMVGKSGQ